MTNDERIEAHRRVKGWLASYPYIKEELGWLDKELRMYEGSIYGDCTANMDGMPRGSAAGDAMVSKIVQLDELRKRHTQRRERLTADLLAREEALERLGDMERKVMRLRYFEGMKWEDICTAINYSWRQTHNYHSRALDKLIQKEGPEQ